MQIRKVKFKDNKVYIEWVEMRPNGQDPDEYMIRSIDAPSPEFKACWERLSAAIVKEAELPSEMVNSITPAGLTISEYADDRWGACITGLRRLENSNAPLVINTPHKPAMPVDSNPNDPCILSTMSVEIIKDMSAAAIAYIQGDRAQQSLFQKEREAVAV